MKNLFVPYELAVIAKEKGFNDECIAAYMSTPKHLIEKQGIFSLRTHGNPFGDDIGRVYNDKLTKGVAAPLYQQIIAWLNKIGFEKHLNIYIVYDGLNNEKTNKAIEEAFKLI